MYKLIVFLYCLLMFIRERLLSSVCCRILILLAIKYFFLANLHWGPNQGVSECFLDVLLYVFLLALTTSAPVWKILVILSTTTLASCLVHFCLALSSKTITCSASMKLILFAKQSNSVCLILLSGTFCGSWIRFLGNLCTTVLIWSDSNACPSENSRSTSVMQKFEETRHLC